MGISVKVLHPMMLEEPIMYERDRFAVAQISGSASGHIGSALAHFFREGWDDDLSFHHDQLGTYVTPIPLEKLRQRLDTVREKIQERGHSQEQIDHDIQRFVDLLALIEEWESKHGTPCYYWVSY